MSPTGATAVYRPCPVSRICRPSCCRAAVSTGLAGVFGGSPRALSPIRADTRPCRAETDTGPSADCPLASAVETRPVTRRTTRPSERTLLTAPVRPTHSGEPSGPGPRHRGPPWPASATYSTPLAPKLKPRGLSRFAATTLPWGVAAPEAGAGARLVPATANTLTAATTPARPPPCTRPLGFTTRRSLRTGGRPAPAPTAADPSTLARTDHPGTPPKPAPSRGLSNAVPHRRRRPSPRRPGRSGGGLDR